MNLFQRLDKGRPTPVEARKQPLSEIERAQRLLDFLQRWGKPTVTPRDIRIYGPKSLRDQQSAIASAEILKKHGWLIPAEPRQRNALEWEIVRRPIIYPTLE
jgi:hypothetical protein